jgi:hypothetical protein
MLSHKHAGKIYILFIVGITPVCVSDQIKVGKGQRTKTRTGEFTDEDTPLCSFVLKRRNTYLRLHESSC